MNREWPRPSHSLSAYRAGCDRNAPHAICNSRGRSDKKASGAWAGRGGREGTILLPVGLCSRLRVGASERARPCKSARAAATRTLRGPDRKRPHSAHSGAKRTDAGNRAGRAKQLEGAQVIPTKSFGGQECVGSLLSARQTLGTRSPVRPAPARTGAPLHTSSTYRWMRPAAL